MRDVLCPNCHKDEFDVVEVNGVKVKQCKLCGSFYQLFDPEVDANYLPDSKDANGNFVKCPKCGCPDFKKTEDFDPFTDLSLIDIILNPRRTTSLTPGYFICTNKKCKFVWKPPLF